MVTEHLDARPEEEVLAEIRQYLESGKKQKKRKKHRPLKVIVFTVLCLAVLYLALYIIGSCRFTVTFYGIKTDKVKQPVRIVGLTDLHNAHFGKENEKLIRRIAQLDPDLILIAGDMVTAGNDDIETTVSLCRKLKELALVYYSYGNHENRMVYGSDLTLELLDEYEGEPPEKDSRLPEALLDAGVVLLNNSAARVQIGDIGIDLVGINTVSGAYFPYSNKMMDAVLSQDKENLKLIIAHRPTISKTAESQEWLQYDLMFSGHTHGGLIRIPGLGGMFREGKIWPWFTGIDSGMHQNSQGTLILGRGLGNNNPVPRIFNVPEIVVADIHS